jgi:hypothetical protein
MNMRKSVSMTLSVLLLAGGFSHLAQAAGTPHHFKPLGPDKSRAADDSLFYPNQFEAAAAAHPDPNALVFFSLCRRAPFTSTTLYAPLSGGNADAIVADTTFTLADGTQCYNPQNEQNIVINPTDSQNVVTSANDYRYGFQALIYYSTNGGNTFTDVLLPGWDSATGASGLFKHVQAGGDPVLAFAADGTLYYCALVYDFSFANRTPSGVAVAASHDGGATWSTTSIWRRCASTTHSAAQPTAMGARPVSPRSPPIRTFSLPAASSATTPELPSIRRAACTAPGPTSGGFLEPRPRIRTRSSGGTELEAWHRFGTEDRARDTRSLTAPSHGDLTDRRIRAAGA